MQMTQWLHKQRERLLDCSHHHIIFTIPHDFNALWMHNTATMMEVLFHCARDSLQEMLSDGRRLGEVEAGFLLALHTWGRLLSLHPHLHCLITDGGPSDGGWQSTCATQLQACLNKLGRIKWNVHLHERYGHSNGMVQYLARYVRGGSMQDGQVAATSAQHIAFRYRPDGDSGTACRLSVMTLTPPAFMRRYLQHVPQPRKHTVRSYGLYAPRKSEPLNRARATFCQPPIAPATPLSWQTYSATGAPKKGTRACIGVSGLVQEAACLVWPMIPMCQ